MADDGYVVITLDAETAAAYDKQIVRKARFQVLNGARLLAFAGKHVKRLGDAIVLHSPVACEVADVAAKFLPPNIGMPLSATSSLLAVVAYYVKFYDQNLSGPTKKTFEKFIEFLESEAGITCVVVEENLAEPVADPKIDPLYDLNELEDLMIASAEMSAVDFVRRLGFSRSMSELAVNSLGLPPLPRVSDMIGDSERLHQLLWDVDV